MTGEQYLNDVRAQFAGYRRRAEGAMTQVSDDDFFRCLGPESNAIAILVKHLAGNLRSRWRDILTSDGEKPDRHRDSEFEITAEDTRAALLERWQSAWTIVEQSLGDLRGTDLDKTITIRTEPLALFHAINRSLTHTAEHVGQIILLARHWAGPAWQTLSIARGGSHAFNAAMEKDR